MNFLTNFEQLCKEHGISPSRALINAGLSNSLYTKWRKSPGAVPNLETLNKIADYFHTTIDTVVGTDPDRVRMDFANYPGLYPLAIGWCKLTEQQKAEIINYARYISKGAIE